MSRAYVLLQFDGVQLAFEQHEVMALESSLDLDFVDGAGPVRGHLEHRGARVDAFCLDSELEPMEWTPPDRRVCAVLRADGAPFALLVGNAAGMTTGELAPYPVPACMSNAQSPLLGLALHEEGVICLARASAVFAGIAARSRPPRPEQEPSGAQP